MLFRSPEGEQPSSEHQNVSQKSECSRWIFVDAEEPGIGVGGCGESRPDSVERASVWKRQGSSWWLQQGNGSGQRSREGWCQAVGSAKLDVWTLLCKCPGDFKAEVWCLKPLLTSSPTQASRPVTAGLLPKLSRSET